MNQIPLTHLFEWDECSDRLRPLLMREFAVNGAKYIVLTDQILRRAMNRPEFADAISREVKEAGLEFCDAHAPFGTREDLDCPRGEERASMIDRLKTVLRIVRDLGVKTCTIHVGNVPFPEYTLDYYHNCILQALEALLPVAETCDVTIAIENIWFPTNTPEKLLSIIDRFRSPHLGICFDSGHANLMEKGREFPESAAASGWNGWADEVPWDGRILEKLLPHVVNCHLHDNFGQYDDHSLPGDGNIDWQYVMSALARAPRLQCIQNEVIPVRRNIPVATLCRTFDRLVAMM
ncbi:MAG: sugar phosphate isomerase/epimerase [Lentisphaeria bacterium]|nr:sugar phosphate isomerase/epimerase [Lentisphaeria bacterium]